MSKLTRAGTIFFKGFIFICAWGATDQCQSRAGEECSKALRKTLPVILNKITTRRTESVILARRVRKSGRLSQEVACSFEKGVTTCTEFVEFESTY